MHKTYFPFIAIIALTLLFSCSRKHNPESSAGATGASTSTTTAKPVVKKAKLPVSKVITVNDNAAKKSFDGRLYYDLDGHRYWKNYNDGKYYLFNKSMYTDSAYTPH